MNLYAMARNNNNMNVDVLGTSVSLSWTEHETQFVTGDVSQAIGTIGSGQTTYEVTADVSATATADGDCNMFVNSIGVEVTLIIGAVGAETGATGSENFPITITQEIYDDTISHEQWHKTHLREVSERFASSQTSNRTCEFYNCFGLNHHEQSQSNCDAKAARLTSLIVSRVKSAVYESFEDYHNLLYTNPAYSHSIVNSSLNDAYGNEISSSIAGRTFPDWDCSDLSGFYLPW